MNFTIEDLKRLSEIYEPLIDRADKLVKYQSEINGEIEKIVWDIEEVDNNSITFRAEDKWGDNHYITFTFEDLVSDDYYQRYKKRYEEQEERKRIFLEEAKRNRALEKEKEERELLKKLQAKYNKPPKENRPTGEIRTDF